MNPHNPFSEDSMRKVLADIQARFEASPHRCAGGCGEHVLRPGESCDPCDSRRRVDLAARRRTDALIETIPPRYRQASFDAAWLRSAVKDSAAIGRAKSAADAKVDRIVLSGPAGTGKTLLGTCILRSLVDRLGMPGRFQSACDLSQARRRAKLGAEAPAVSESMSAAILLLDDVGQAERSQEIVDVIFARHERMAPTVYTVGHTLAEMQTKYGDGVCRRIYEGSTMIELRAAEQRQLRAVS